MKADYCKVDVISPEHLRSFVDSSCVWICCAGFEDRALAASKIVAETSGFDLVVVKLKGGDPANQVAYGTAVQMFRISDPKQTFEYEVFFCEHASSELIAYLTDRGFDRGSTILIDISGFPSHGICQVLHAVRTVYPVNRIVCIYTSAETYYPTKGEYDQSFGTLEKFDANNLPDSLTYESSGILQLNSFNGISVRQDRACLFLFAGFEKHRAIAAVEGINPKQMVIAYSEPPDINLKWRLDLSKKLHHDLHSHIDRAEIHLENTNLSGVIEELRLYYDMLYDHMNIVLCPMNSKLHTLACYLFWELYQDVQICFTLPVRYLPSRSSKGVGQFYAVELPKTKGFNLLFGIEN